MLTRLYFNGPWNGVNLQSSDATKLQFEMADYDTVVLDIEGTITPITFVKDTLVLTCGSTRCQRMKVVNVMAIVSLCHARPGGVPGSDMGYAGTGATHWASERAGTGFGAQREGLLVNIDKFEWHILFYPGTAGCQQWHSRSSRDTKGWVNIRARSMEIARRRLIHTSWKPCWRHQKSHHQEHWVANGRRSKDRGTQVFPRIHVARGIC